MAENTGVHCACSSAPSLIFACSGAADVGAVADQAARKLTQNGVGKMFCLAGVGGRISGIMKSTEAASAILAIDGCPLNCARQCLIEAGFAGFGHVQLADLGLKKGETAVTNENIEKVVAAGARVIGDKVLT